MEEEYPADSETEHGQGEDAEHGPGEHAEHLAHYAHRLHVVLEEVEHSEHRLHHWGGYAKEIQAAQRLAKTHAQMAFDVRRMRKGVAVIERVAKQGGKVGPKAAAQLTKARSALTAAQKAFASERPAVAEAEKLLRTAAACRGTTQGVLVQKIGQLTVKFTAALSQSPVGRALLVTNRVVLSKPVVNGLLVVGAALDAIAAYQQSPAQTQAGRLTNAALAAGFGVLIAKKSPVAIVDAFVLPTGYKLSEIYKGTAAALPAIGEGLLAGDTRAMDEFHARAMKGSYGKVMEAASEAGEYWDQKGLRSGLREFEDSLRWWVSH